MFQILRKFEGAMPAVIEARSLVEVMLSAMGRKPLKLALPELHRRVGISTSRLQSIWDRKARRIDSEEMDLLRAAAQRCVASRPACKHADRLDAAAASLEAIDADFHRAEIDRLRDVARIVRSAPVGSKA